jgi:hypothetical protein
MGGPALSYMMFFPYIDSLWFGESFHYDSPADTFLVEIAGASTCIYDVVHARKSD